MVVRNCKSGGRKTPVSGLNPEKALVIMKSDLEVVFGKRLKKTREEVKQELDDFSADIKRATAA
jgi:hypothetical protein